MTDQQSQDPPRLAFAESYIIALQIGAVWGHCYENAYPAFFANPKLFYPSGTFIEGWIVFKDGPYIVLMEHGWLVSEQKIIDPTIVLVTLPDQEVFYFPGVIRSWEELDKLEGELFPYVRFDKYGDDGMGHPGYKAAYAQAKAKADALVLSTGLELVEVTAGEQGTVSVGNDSTGGILIISLEKEEPDQA